MYRCILAPVDGSAFGEHALPYAGATARAAGAVLHLSHVHVPLIAPSGVETVTFRGAWDDVTREQSRGYLAGLARQLSAAYGIQVETSLIDGPVAGALADQALHCGAGLVVMSTHAHIRLRRIWHHGVAEQVARELPVPVLLIHPDREEEEPDLTRAPDLRHVLIPLDGSAYAESMAPHAVEFGGTFGARYTLLQVIRPEFEIGYTLLGQDGHVNHHRLSRSREQAMRYLEGVARRMRSRGLTVATRVVVAAEPAVAIVDFIRTAPQDARPDLIAMETHPHRPISRILGAHTADLVLHESPVPVLLFEPDAPLESQPAAAEPEVRLVERRA